MHLIAHRGNDGINKENSIKAICNSLSFDYVDGVEFDVRITLDKKIVICHNIIYDGMIIKNTKLCDLVGIETLDELLKNIDSSKILLIEIKEESFDYSIIEVLYKIIKKYKFNYFFMSFNYGLISLFKKKYPKYKCGLLIGIKMNTSHFDNDLDFNAVNFIHFDKLRECDFVWTVNYRLFDFDGYIITDRAYELNML